LNALYNFQSREVCFSKTNFAYLAMAAALSIIYSPYFNVVHTVHCVHNYQSSSNQHLMRHFSYTKLHCLINNPTRFGVRQRHPQGVLSKLLNFSTRQMAINTCPTIYCGNAIFTPMHNFEKFMKVASTVKISLSQHMTFKYF